MLNLTDLRAERLSPSEALTRTILLTILALLPLVAGGCGAASRPPDPAQPRAGAPASPVLFVGGAERREQALAVWLALTRDQRITDPPMPELHPITATVRALPAALTPPLHLPKVGSEGTFVTEEEMRESLRRFISSASQLLGVELKDLSLVEHTGRGGETQQVRYRQRPFDYPLRGGYGELTISFTSDRRVIQLSSTAIPDATTLGQALAQVRPRLTREQASAQVANQSVVLTDAAGQQQTRTLDSAEEVSVRELVIYPVTSGGGSSTLELHLAWEIAVGPSSSASFAYVDASTGELIAASGRPE